MTPGTQPQKVKRNTMNMEPQPDLPQPKEEKKGHYNTPKTHTSRFFQR